LTLQNPVPVDGLEQFFDFRSRVTRGVDSADEAAHAGSGHIEMNA
jgi:hypothetical protein